MNEIMYQLYNETTCMDCYGQYLVFYPRTNQLNLLQKSHYDDRVHALHVGQILDWLPQMSGINPSQYDLLSQIYHLRIMVSIDDARNCTRRKIYGCPSLKCSSHSVVLNLCCYGSSGLRSHLMFCCVYTRDSKYFDHSNSAIGNQETSLAKYS